MVLAAMAAAGTAFGAVPANLYIQDGLVAHWDAVDNVGYGRHDYNTTDWINLAEGSTVGDLTLANLLSYTWRDSYLEMNSGAAQSGRQLITTNSVALGGAFTIEVMAYATDGIVRRWEAEPWIQAFEAWATAAEGYLERINGTRFTAQSTLLKNETLAFTTTYNGSRHTQYIRRADGTVVSNGANKIGYTFNGLMAFLSNLAAGGRGYSVRLYTKVLSDVERHYNSALDQMRFQGRAYDAVVLPNGWHLDADLNLLDANDAVLHASAVRKYVWTGAANTGLWSDAGNWTDENGGAVATVPGLGDRATIGAGAAVTVNADASVMELTVAAGATVTVAADASLVVTKATYNGQGVGRAILSGDSTVGWVVDWVAGAGAVRTCGADGSVPIRYHAPAADGWYDFGVSGTIGSASVSSDRTFTNIDYADCELMGFPPQPKIRLHDNVILGRGLPADADFDLTGLTQVMLQYPNDYPLETITVPSGVRFRLIPGPVVATDVANKWQWTPATAPAITKDVVLEGTWYSCSSYARDPNFVGKLSGSGLLTTDNFGREVTISGEQAFNGTFTFTGGSYGSRLIVKSTRITGTIKSVNLAGTSASSEWHTNSSYYCSYVRFAPSAPTTDVLKFDQFPTQGGGFGWKDTLKKFWRHGPALFFWGDNRVHINRLTGGNALHVVADTSLNRTPRAQTGNAYLEIDEITSTSTLYPSTNVFITVGKVTTSASFDYACESNAVNVATLDITNSCASTAKVKAQDLAMLPARISGFAGNVTLTKADVRSYAIPVDLSQGTNTLYQTVGCIGSGTLTAAPATGTINATIDTTKVPVKGDYALARFTGGGSLLSNWTVTVNGKAEDSFLGMKVTPVKDATGIWLKVRKPGVWVIVR